MDRSHRVSVDPEHGGEVFEFAERQINGSSAFLADDVVVFARVDQVDHSRSMTEMNVPQVARLLEHVDGAIDRGWVNLGTDQGLDLLMEVGRGQVIVMGFGQHLAHGSAGDCDTKTGGPQRGEQDVAIDVH
jgi:hypothetical protein